ncbi:hypothetical protein L1887_23169 [Cichorium endivia]|nr:hypothetical protein L1887_23169 [Cichorium endivia]
MFTSFQLYTIEGPFVPIYLFFFVPTLHHRFVPIHLFFFVPTLHHRFHPSFPSIAADLLAHGDSDELHGYIGDMDKAAATSLSFSV